jgi:hypothetical protein
MLSTRCTLNLTLEREYEWPRPSCAFSRSPSSNAVTNCLHKGRERQHELHGQYCTIIKKAQHSSILDITRQTQNREMADGAQHAREQTLAKWVRMPRRSSATCGHGQQTIRETASFLAAMMLINSYLCVLLARDGQVLLHRHTQLQEEVSRDTHGERGREIWAPSPPPGLAHCRHHAGSSSAETPVCVRAQ